MIFVLVGIPEVVAVEIGVVGFGVDVTRSRGGSGGAVEAFGDGECGFLGRETTSPASRS